MKLVLPTIPKLKVIYSYLLLKAIESKNPVISWESLSEAIAVAGITPTNSNVKKFILALKAHDPPLIEYYSVNLYSPLYKLLVYVVYFDNGREMRQATLGEAALFKRDLVFALCHEDTENTTTFTDLMKEDWKEEIDNLAERAEREERALEVLRGD